MTPEFKKKLKETGIFSPFDIKFADIISSFAEHNTDILALTAAMLSWTTTVESNVCLNINEWIGKKVPGGIIKCPNSVKLWRDALKNTPSVGCPGEVVPLILDQNDKIYLHKFWTYEKIIAEQLLKRSRIILKPHKKQIETFLQSLGKKHKIDDQDKAVIISLLKPLSIISGGPGTGKSTVTGKIVSILKSVPDKGSTRIIMTAPTGKAVARLTQMVSGFDKHCNIEAVTLHRLLEADNYGKVRKHHDNPIEADVLIIDEVSMVDIGLMAKLLDATQNIKRIIMLGDKSQLSSVEAGTVFGDICNSVTIGQYSKNLSEKINEFIEVKDIISHKEEHKNYPPLTDCIVELSKNYRFKTNSGIWKISTLIKNGDGIQAFEILKLNSVFTDISLLNISSSFSVSKKLKKITDSYFKPCLRIEQAEIALKKMSEFRILCAIRYGDQGVKKINQEIEKLLEINPVNGWYHGRPIIISRNDYTIGLFTGDSGVALNDKKSGDLKVYFHSQTGEIRSFLPIQIPDHETAWAITTHKSQGSEYNHVIMILPLKFSQLLGRELLYTGITRAKDKSEIWAADDIFIETCNNKINRTSGLMDKLSLPPV